MTARAGSRDGGRGPGHASSSVPASPGTVHGGSKVLEPGHENLPSLPGSPSPLLAPPCHYPGPSLSLSSSGQYHLPSESSPGHYHLSSPVWRLTKP